jgi:hypothetical protein
MIIGEVKGASDIVPDLPHIRNAHDLSIQVMAIVLAVINHPSRSPNHVVLKDTVWVPSYVYVAWNEMQAMCLSSL